MNPSSHTVSYGSAHGPPTSEGHAHMTWRRRAWTAVGGVTVGILSRNGRVVPGPATRLFGSIGDSPVACLSYAGGDRCPPLRPRRPWPAPVIRGRGSVGAGRRQLEEAIGGYFTSAKTRAKPLVWTRRTGDILSIPRRFGLRAAISAQPGYCLAGPQTFACQGPLPALKTDAAAKASNRLRGRLRNHRLLIPSGYPRTHLPQSTSGPHRGGR